MKIFNHHCFQTLHTDIETVILFPASGYLTICTETVILSPVTGYLTICTETVVQSPATGYFTICTETAILSPATCYLTICTKSIEVFADEWWRWPWLAKGSINMLPPQWMNMQQKRNSWKQCSLCGPRQGYITSTPAESIVSQELRVSGHHGLAAGQLPARTWTQKLRNLHCWEP
jgi:hypothetical protein